MKMRRLKLIVTFLLSGILSIQAQISNGVMRLDEARGQTKRVIITIPDVKGYKVLKCDFHTHTVFSDGAVWPTIRLQEAWEEGLDAFSITDHIEYHPHKSDVSTDNNRPWELIKTEAKKNNIIFIKGAEISRITPPGHFNGIFIGDASGYITDVSTNEKDREAVMKAAGQDAFIFWNHPGWKPNIKGSYEWIDFVNDLHKNKALHGIEVFNGFGFHMKALDWCIDKGLTVMGSTDIHNMVRYNYDLADPDNHRTMTLVFAKDRSEASIKEALMAGRTVAWSNKYLAGKEENVRDLFYACVEVMRSHFSEPVKDGKARNYYEIRNNSDLYFELESTGGNSTAKIILHPRTSQVISAESGQSSISYKVVTAYVRSDKHLQVNLSLK
jgi:hypothetical protein